VTSEPADEKANRTRRGPSRRQTASVQRPRILADLRGDGDVISGTTVAKAMRRLRLRGICSKTWRTTTVTDASDT